MTWLAWRQHRLQGAIALALLALLGIALWITGVQMAHAYHTSLTTCVRPNNDCRGLDIFRGQRFVTTLVNLTVAAPVLIGVFWGASTVGREYDTGTNLLVWTQSVPRRHWLRIKVITLLVSSTLVGALLSGMVTWWSTTRNMYLGNRFEPLQFDQQGLMPAVYTLFAAALGLASGVIWRRVLPAIGTTVAGFLAVRLVVEEWIRPHYQALAVLTHPLDGPTNTAAGSWRFSDDLVYHGRVVTGPVRVAADCVDKANRDVMDACMSNNGYAIRTTYQPASRYWTFQWIEAGIFVALTAVLVAVAVIAVRRRDA